MAEEIELEDHKGGRNEPQKSNVQEKPRLTIILAVKGQSSSDKSKIARQLVDDLGFPLIDQDDITKALQKSLSTTGSLAAAEHLFNDLPFESVCQIASTQLRSRIGVTVSAPLSHHAQFKRLKELAIEMGARMIIIDCIIDQADKDCIIDQADKEYEYYDAGNVPRYTVDPKKPLDLEELAASIRLMDGDSSSSQSWFSTSQVKEPGKYQMMREEMQRHLHELTYFEELPRNVERSTCQKCRQAVSSGPIHWCTECQEEFILHKSCAELPDKSPEQVLENCPTDLKSRTPKHNFPQKRICQVCDFGKKGFSDDCFDCLIQTHLECGFLPTVFNSLRHEHPLNFVITPMSYNYEYQCCACDDFGKLISYKCYKCDYDLHIDCALDSDTEKVVLRHQVLDERHNAEDWMLEYALQATVAKLAPARKRKVELLVEAFETVLPQQAID